MCIIINIYTSSISMYVHYMQYSVILCYVIEELHHHHGSELNCK